MNRREVIEAMQYKLAGKIVKSLDWKEALETAIELLKADKKQKSTQHRLLKERNSEIKILNARIAEMKGQNENPSYSTLDAMEKKMRLEYQRIVSDIVDEVIVKYPDLQEQITGMAVTGLEEEKIAKKVRTILKKFIGDKYKLYI